MIHNLLQGLSREVYHGFLRGCCRDGVDDAKG